LNNHAINHHNRDNLNRTSNHERKNEDHGI
jgi:hypothetical protein